MKETFKQFKERVVHPQDDLFAILFLNFITVRLAYMIIKYKIGITANAVTYTRMFLLGPAIILILIVAPMSKILYGIALVLSYVFLLSDWLDGQIARGSKKTSKKGAILDSVADRFSTIIMLVLLFSMGAYLQNVVLLLSSIALFSLKCFHMMMITKLYYYGIGNKKNSEKIFGADTTGKMGISALFKKASSLIKIKRWGGTLGGSDRFFITVMIPLILVLLGFYSIAAWLLSAFSLFLIVFFVIRIKNLFKMIK